MPSYSSSENKYYAIISMSYIFLSCTKKKYVKTSDKFAQIGKTKIMGNIKNCKKNEYTKSSYPFMPSNTGSNQETIRIKTAINEKKSRTFSFDKNFILNNLYVIHRSLL